MPISQRAQRLRTNLRLAVLENITALNRQRKAAVQAGDGDAATNIQDDINGLHDRLDDLSFLSLQDLEDSREVTQTITDLQKAAGDLEDEAGKIQSIADALKKGAEIADKISKIIVKLRDIIPV
ncbi:hypothetical protein [Aestuariispira ectoiniformans]|uniref:hypothetical protein n=1 Tax=Aestuariispira ectoiniformans TaxID=2775080 RepID=UPI00223C338F|nr:hypothetical protein [Aestuariispira ectoiniformans]